ncbi:gamma subclass chorismate mutase AroQ [Vibrio tetraodonis]|uniref:gamma subclass chorismate mutase AroQ n=1 Tax=Vibrio tetraodonis TaxID=2231647 RepID=UPI000E09F9C6|nr:gamma subclass chorismate mutase AroQ [Vibrio tetraodonis]
MHKIKGLLLSTLLILPVFAHAEESYKTVFEKINQRMSFMQDVALYKINHHLAIEDVEREAVVVEKSKAASEKYGLDGDSTTEFTRSLISAAKAIQYRYRADILSQTADIHKKPRDLKTEIRPALIKLSGELNAAISDYLKTGNKFTDDQYQTFATVINDPYLKDNDKKLIFKALQNIQVKTVSK